MESGITQQETKKEVAPIPPKPAMDNQTSSPEDSPLIKAQSQIITTYEAHMEAQKEFEEAFKNVARQDKLAYENAEKRFQSYKTALEQAFRKRETTEQAALAVYKETLIKAGEAYQASMQQALNECQLNTKEAGKILSDLAKIEYHPAYKEHANTVARFEDWLRKF